MAAKKQATKTPKKAGSKIVKPVKSVQAPVIEDRLNMHGSNFDSGIAPCDETNTDVVHSDSERLFELISKLEGDEGNFHSITIGNGKVHLERRSKYEPFMVFKTTLLDALKAMEANDLEL